MINELNRFRKYEYSIVEYLKDLLPDRIQVVTEDEEEEIETPHVGVFYESLIPRPLELGNNDFTQIYNWSILILADSKSQRDYISFSISDSLQRWYIPVLDFESSDEEMGRLVVGNVSMRPVRIPTETTDKLRYMAQIRFVTKFREAS